MKYQGKSMMSLNEMAGLAIEYEGDGYVTGYPIVSGDDAYILNGVIEANEEYITINQWVPVFSESLKPVSPSLTDDQQVVLDYLKNIYSDVYEDCTPLETMYLFGGRRAWSEESNLTDKEEFQVLAAFASYGLRIGTGGTTMREIVAWLSADGGNDIYETITVPNDFTEEQVEMAAKQAVFNNIDWGWYEKEGEE